MNIGFYAEALCCGGGGIERFVSKLTNYLSINGHQCTIFHKGNTSSGSIYKLHEEVKLFDLKLRNKNDLAVAKKYLLKNNFDVLCVANSGAHRLYFLDMLNNTGIPFLMSERSNPKVIEEILFLRNERLATFLAADGIHLLSKNYLYSIPDFLREKVTVISNPAPNATPRNLKKEDAIRKKILLVSRLEEKSKQITLFISAFSKIQELYPDWDCIICGDGPQKSKYEELIAKYCLGKRMFLKGNVPNPKEYYASSHIFCMPSSFEGIPNALLEAQSFGLPLVGFAECSGVNEIIVHEENGYLVEKMTPDCLAKYLQKLMDNRNLREFMSNKCYELLSRNDEQAIFEQWETMLYNVAQKKGNTCLNFPKISEKEIAKIQLLEILSREHPMGHTHALHEKIQLNIKNDLRKRIKHAF